MRNSSIALLAAFLTASCAGTPKPQIDRVVTETVYIAPPKEFMECEGPVKLTDELYAELTVESATETTYNEKYVLPGIQAHEACFKNMARIRDWSKTLPGGD